MRSLEFLFLRQIWILNLLAWAIGGLSLWAFDPAGDQDSPNIILSVFSFVLIFQIGAAFTIGLMNYIYWTSRSPANFLRRSLQLIFTVAACYYLVLCILILILNKPLPVGFWDVLFQVCASLILSLYMFGGGNMTVRPQSVSKQIVIWTFVIIPVAAVLFYLYLDFRAISYMLALLIAWFIMISNLSNRSILYPENAKKLLIWGSAVIAVVFSASIPIENHRGNVDYVGGFKTQTWNFADIEEVHNFEDLYRWHARRDRPMTVAEFQQFAAVLQEYCPMWLSENAAYIPCRVESMQGQRVLWSAERDGFSMAQADELMSSGNDYARLTGIVAVRGLIKEGQAVPLETKVKMESLAGGNDRLAQAAQITLKVIEGKWPSRVSRGWGVDLYQEKTAAAGLEK